MSLYYRHSGQFSPPAALVALLMGAAAASLLGALYAYIVLYLPLAGWITFVISGGFGLCVGVAVAKACRIAKVRNQKVALGIALVAQLVGFYVSWGVWMYALLVRAEVQDISLATCLAPATLWEAIKVINGTGAWTVFGMQPTGISLALLWLLEAAIVFGLCLLSVDLSDPFCEKCKIWCPSKPIATVDPMSPEELKTVLEGRQLERLTLIQTDETQERIVLDLASCARCGDLQTLSARHITIKIKDGKREDEINKVVSHLLLTPDEAVALQNLHLLKAE